MSMCVFTNLTTPSINYSLLLPSLYLRCIGHDDGLSIQPTQRYQPIVQSGNLLVNRTLVTDIAELCEQTDWIAAVRQCCLGCQHSTAHRVTLITSYSQHTHFQPLFASRVNVIGVLFSAFPGRYVVYCSYPQTFFTASL